jgi:hypothetical protein
VGKTPKTYDKWEAHKHHLVKALACLCQDSNVIKSFTIHSKTMEAYTLWWNGGTFQDMLDYNMKNSFVMDS